MPRTVADIGLCFAAMAVVTVVAAAAGAANFGTALTFGEMGFVLALVWVLVKR